MGGQRRWWREWDFIDRLGLAVAVATALAVIALTLATALNGDGSSWP